MTTIRLICDPYSGNVRLFIEETEITAPENKVYGFLKENGLIKALYPFNRRYVIWRGLLPELMSEANDSELRIVFEGRSGEFHKLEQAFDECRPMVQNLGYENHWELCHIKNFETENLKRDFVQLAASLKDMCESRSELYEVEHLISMAKTVSLKGSCQALVAFLNKHRPKWEQDKGQYQKEKSDYINMLEDQVLKLSMMSEGEKE